MCFEVWILLFNAKMRLNYIKFIYFSKKNKISLKRKLFKRCFRGEFNIRSLEVWNSHFSDNRRSKINYINAISKAFMLPFNWVRQGDDINHFLTSNNSSYFIWFFIRVGSQVEFLFSILEILCTYNIYKKL